MTFLPSTLEDIDSVNFDLGVHDYNPIAHQPHPPGYPVYILAAKLAHRLVRDHARALSYVSAVCGSLSVIPLFLLFRRLTSTRGAVLASFITLLNPVVWFNSIRPMSDSMGFLAVAASQCLLVRGITRDAAGRSAPREWLVGALLAGLSIGVRLQAIVLVLPILIYGVAREPAIRRSTAIAFIAGVTAWLWPLLHFSGGATTLVQSFAQMVRVAGPVEPLAVHWSIHRAAFAAMDVLLAPWATSMLGVPIAVLALVGFGILGRTDREPLIVAALLYVPYGAYHYLLQWTETVRYAIPLVPFVALLASMPIVRLRTARPTIVAALIFSAVSIAVTLPALRAYAKTPSPPFQAIDRIRRELAARDHVIIAGHYVFQRYFKLLPPNADVLHAAPNDSVRALTAYWQRGGQTPILFLRRPSRTNLLLVGPDSQKPLASWAWPESVRPFLRGERPLRVELVQLDPPAWFCDSGFLISLEAGPVDVVMREAHRLYMRADAVSRNVLMASGVLARDSPAEIRLRVADQTQERWTVAKQFIIRTFVRTPENWASAYVPLSFETDVPVAFTDAWVQSDDRPAIRPADGFYFPERDSETMLFRWIAPTARAAVYLPGRGGHLTIAGRIPQKYYKLPLTLSIDWNGRPLRSVVTRSTEFRIDDYLPANHPAWGELTLDTSQYFVPDQRVRNGDRRVLAVQIYTLTLQ